MIAGHDSDVFLAVAVFHCTVAAFSWTITTPEDAMQASTKSKEACMDCTAIVLQNLKHCPSSTEAATSVESSAM
jgi:hypothetical protein